MLVDVVVSSYVNNDLHFSYAEMEKIATEINKMFPAVPKVRVISLKVCLLVGVGAVPNTIIHAFFDYLPRILQQ